MTENCYFYAPDHLKPLMLGLIENAVQDQNVEGSCLAMVNYAKASLTDSMQPWFDAQFGASEASALLRVFENIRSATAESLFSTVCVWRSDVHSQELAQHRVF